MEQRAIVENGVEIKDLQPDPVICFNLQKGDDGLSKTQSNLSLVENSEPSLKEPTEFTKGREKENISRLNQLKGELIERNEQLINLSFAAFRKKFRYYGKNTYLLTTALTIPGL